ncbi:hypothetical protein ACQJBY_019604 [Aegilops geniculata]
MSRSQEVLQHLQPHFSHLAYEKKTSPRWMYDLGRKKNFAQVFGNDKKYWFIPAYSEEDLRRMPALQGLDYPVRTDLDGQEL